MTAAATTPHTASRKGDWAAGWPLKPAAPALEASMPSPPAKANSPQPAGVAELHEFLPPPSASSCDATGRPTTVTPWGVDPSRLQKLMMGSVQATVGSCTFSVPDFDPAAGINKHLPHGWERCLDLQSGEVFIKKCEGMANKTWIPPRIDFWPDTRTSDTKQASARPNKTSDKTMQGDEQSVDWMPGKTVSPSQNAMSKGKPAFMKMDAKMYGGKEKQGSPDRPPICLDLDLRLTSNSRSRLASEVPELQSSSNLWPALSARGDSRAQTWKWQPVAYENERPASIQEMVSESTMATSVCSKCLMYVLLNKSNPTCPRCFNPIILDCGGRQTSSVKKRPRLELSPDVLSLSTDSSR